jgi:hypothetical protein
VAAAVSANEGLQPLDYMLQVMRDPTARYRHPQLQAVAHKHLNAHLTIMQPSEPKLRLTAAALKPGLR